ncbi:hypothetical protein, partial [Shouchella miscanthi]|nr:hypothetical protein [Shouchella miscanthi]
VEEESETPSDVSNHSDEITLSNHATLIEKTFLLSTPAQGDLTEFELETGEEVKIIEQTEDFVLVESKDKQGWVSIESLTYN